MTAALSLAVAQPVSVLGDVAGNAANHASLIAGIGARVVVFPELSLTGYAMDAEPVEPADPRLAPIVRACAASGSVALVGAPTSGEDGRRRISMFRVDGAGAATAYDKCFLGGGEPDHFVPGDGPRVLDVDGWRLGLAICKDTGVPDHAATTVALGIDVYVAGVCEAAADRHVTGARAERIVRDHGVWVAFAGFAGPTGGGFSSTAGCSGIWRPDSTAAAQLGPDPGEAARTDVVR